MNQVDEKINNDEFLESDLIDVESMDFTEEQTFIRSFRDGGAKLDLLDRQLSCEPLIYSEEEYQKLEKKFMEILDQKPKDELLPSQTDRHKFDSRTFVKPKRRPPRPSIHNMVDVVRNSASPTLNKFKTYNKYTAGPINPILRLKTFNVDTDTENSSQVKEFASKRRTLVREEDSNIDDSDPSLASSTNPSSENIPSKPINIDLSQPAQNVHSAFNNVYMDRVSGMFQSGDSFMRMSPPSLVNSLLDSSGTFHMDSMDDRKSLTSRISDIPASGRESQDPMFKSITTSLLDDKEMNASFLSQSTVDNNSFLEPPSLVSSINTSYINSMTKSKTDTEQNLFSSTTFTNLEQSNRLLTSRPRINPYSMNKPSVNVKLSESYTKSREEGCQIGPVKVETSSQDAGSNEPVTIHYSNDKYKNEAEKENINTSFEKDDAFYKEMDVQKPIDSAKNSLNMTLDKQELNEIIQARQKLSIARQALPNDVDKMKLTTETKTIQLPNATITVPKQSIETAMALLSTRRNNYGFDKEREAPRRNATFKKITVRTPAVDTTLVSDREKIIDINSATLNLGDNTLKNEWCSQDRAMVGSNESTDTGTFSSSSPPDSVPDNTNLEPRASVSSTPLTTLKKPSIPDLLDIHHTISPILDQTVNDKSYTVMRVPSALEQTYDMSKGRPINTATLVKRGHAKRDIMTKTQLVEKKSAQFQKPLSPPRTGSCESIVAPTNNVPRKTNLPTSKLKQFSSHRELSRIPGTNVPRPSIGGRGTMMRRPVYASNPALSPTAAQGNTTLVVEKEPEQKPAPVIRPLVRQGTETLRRERPQSLMVAPKDLRTTAPPSVGPPLRNNHYSVSQPSPTRPYSIAGASQLRNQSGRPGTVPVNRVNMALPSSEHRPATSGSETNRVSALPRPSRLPAPRRTIRPPSVYAAAPTDNEHY